jgi:phage shock protein C
MKKNISEKVFFGVCSGIAKYINFDVSLIRLIFILLTLFGFGTPILIYVLLAIIMPAE